MRDAAASKKLRQVSDAEVQKLLDAERMDTENFRAGKVAQAKSNSVIDQIRGTVSGESSRSPILSESEHFPLLDAAIEAMLSRNSQEKLRIGIRGIIIRAGQNIRELAKLVQRRTTVPAQQAAVVHSVDEVAVDNFASFIGASFRPLPNRSFSESLANLTDFLTGKTHLTHFPPQWFGFLNVLVDGIARKITEELAKELATKMAPALTGLSTPRPTRRPNRRLDLRRTVLANLKTARVDQEGVMRLNPEQFYFRTPAHRTMDWHLIFVVDVSGSMEPSVIYSALTAAIFSALPALSVSFLAFSTEVIDFTNHVEDPLAMLMEVQVGGGTYIWKGLMAARERLKVPARTILLLVTDFEEGGSVGAVLREVQAIVDTGAKALGLAALSDDGKPRYHTGIAAQVAACGMPVAALSPLELARWVGEQIR